MFICIHFKKGSKSKKNRNHVNIFTTLCHQPSINSYRYTRKKTEMGEKQIKFISLRNQVFMEELQTKGWNSNTETRLRENVQKNVGTVHRRAGEWYINGCLQAEGKRARGSLQFGGFISSNGVWNLLSTEGVWVVLQDVVWTNLPAEFLQKPCASVLRRSDTVLMTKGSHSKHWFDLDFSSVNSVDFSSSFC